MAREEPELLTDIRDFTTLFYVIFETQVLQMVRVVYAEYLKCEICSKDPWLNHFRFSFLETQFLV